MKVQITISMLERILNNAKEAKANDNNLSNTITLECTQESDTHLGAEMIAARIKSGYAECDGKAIFNHWQ